MGTYRLLRRETCLQQLLYTSAIAAVIQPLSELENTTLIDSEVLSCNRPPCSLLICTLFIPSCVGECLFPKSNTAKGLRGPRKTRPVFATSLTGADLATDWPCSAAVSDHTSHLSAYPAAPDESTGSGNQTNMGYKREQDKTKFGQSPYHI